MSDVIVSANEVTKVYPRGNQEVHALRGISLDVERGEYVSIMGPSGSGKSTFFNVVGGLDRPTSGHVTIAGHSLSDLTAGQLSWVRCHMVGFIFQMFNLVPSMTALDNVALWHERDISHSSAERIILPDSCLALDYILDLLTGVMKGLRVYTDRMKENMELTRGLLFSQRVMLTLVEKGMSREEAYKIVQENAAKTWDEGRDFRELIGTDSRVMSKLGAYNLPGLFSYEYYVRFVDDTFKRVGLL